MCAFTTHLIAFVAGMVVMLAAMKLTGPLLRRLS